MVTIWHNPRCSKSRQTLKLLQEKGIEPEVRRYLDAPPTVQELEDVLGKLGIEPAALLRRREKEYQELGLSDADRDRIVRAMAEHPRLIERPVVINGDRAALGRPPEQVLEIL